MLFPVVFVPTGACLSTHVLPPAIRQIAAVVCDPSAEDGAERVVISAAHGTAHVTVSETKPHSDAGGVTLLRTGWSSTVSPEPGPLAIVQTDSGCDMFVAVSQQPSGGITIERLHAPRLL
jgi:hypothetical protein